MLELRRVEELAFLFEIVKDERIRLFHKDAGIRRLRGHIALSVHELYKRQIVPAADTRIVLTMPVPSFMVT